MISLRPIGIVGTDGLARTVAERIAATGRRVLLHVSGTAQSGKLPKNIEAVATPTDIGFDCEIVLSFIDDSTVSKKMSISGGVPIR